MEQWVINVGELKDFIEKHKLSDRNSNIQFNSLVSIDTEKNSIRNEKISIWITFSNFNSAGELHLNGNNLNHSLFPTVFEAKWQNMKHVNNEYLLITGNHKNNSEIGKYTVKITPLEKFESD
jgi:hypothetical protein